MAFIDLTKAFDLVRREGIFQVMEQIACHPNFSAWLSRSIPTWQQLSAWTGNQQFLLSVVSSRVACWSLFSIFFTVLLSQAFHFSSEDVHHHSVQMELYNIARLPSNRSLVRWLRYLLFPFRSGASNPTYRLSKTRQNFGLRISIPKTEFMIHDSSYASFTIHGERLQAVEILRYLGSTLCGNLSIDVETNSGWAMPQPQLPMINKRDWTNENLSIRTKIQVYHACVLSSPSTLPRFGQHTPDRKTKFFPSAL